MTMMCGVLIMALLLPGTPVLGSSETVSENEIVEIVEGSETVEVSGSGETALDDSGSTVETLTETVYVQYDDTVLLEKIDVVNNELVGVSGHLVEMSDCMLSMSEKLVLQAQKIDELILSLEYAVALLFILVCFEILRIVRSWGKRGGVR